jgi:hypothetical protein
MFGGSSHAGAAALQLIRLPAFQAQERRTSPERSDAMTGKLPADQGRAPHLYDEQLQRQQQEKMLMRGRDERPDLLQPATAGQARNSTR